MAVTGTQGAGGERTLRFYFDYISNNAYLAWVVLPELAERFDLRIEPVPVLFAGLLEAHGQLGPAEVPAKAFWMWKNTQRKAAQLGVPLHAPAFHPFNPLLSLRASSVPGELAERRALIDALFRAVWVEGRHVSEPEVVEAVATSVGLDGASVVAAAGSAEAKARLREVTDAAIAAGVFGVPSFGIGDEIFWGYDDLPYLEQHLRGEDPMAGARLPGRPKASARRRRFR